MKNNNDERYATEHRFRSKVQNVDTEYQHQAGGSPVGANHLSSRRGTTRPLLRGRSPVLLLPLPRETLFSHFSISAPTIAWDRPWEASPRSPPQSRVCLRMSFHKLTLNSEKRPIMMRR